MGPYFTAYRMLNLKEYMATYALDVIKTKIFRGLF